MADHSAGRRVPIQRRAYLRALGLAGATALAGCPARRAPSGEEPADGTEATRTPPTHTEEPTTATDAGTTEAGTTTADDGVPVYGDGDVLVTFEVEVPPWTPPEDRVFVTVDSFRWALDGGPGMPMVETERGAGRWAAGFRAVANGTETYRYNRNNLEYPTAERFEPDDPDARREVAVGEEPVSVADEVAAWRWLRPTPPAADVPSAPLPPGPPREDPFLVGTGLLDYHTSQFDRLVPSTLDRIAGRGVDWVSITQHPVSITGVDPLSYSTDPRETIGMTDERLREVVAAARRRGLRVALSVGVAEGPSVPGVSEALREPHPDDWYRALAERWTAEMVAAARLAGEAGVELFVVANQWPFFGEQTTDQQRIVNAALHDAIAAIREVFDGIVTTGFYATWTPEYDWYGALDWPGDKWWFPMADVRDPSREALLEAARTVVDDRYRPLAERFDRPVFVHQVGYSSYDGATGAVSVNIEGPAVSERFPVDPAHPFDFQEQVDAHDAVLHAVYEAAFEDSTGTTRPVFAGALSFGYEYWDSHDKGPGVRAKPAEAVWDRWATADRD